LKPAVYGVAMLRWRRAANVSTYRQAHVAGTLWMRPPQHSGGSKFDSGAREPNRLPACICVYLNQIKWSTRLISTWK